MSMKEKIELINHLKSLLPKCGRMQVKTFQKGDNVMTYLAKRNQICVVLNGVVDLVRYDASGSKAIVERYRENDLFGEAFHPVVTNNELFVVAKEKSEILQFIYDDLEEKCNKNCKTHTVLYNVLLKLTILKTIDQNIRIELLTKTTIREKLLFYFSYLSINNYGKEFTIPFSFTDLSDYFNVDRSALMRELKHLSSEGFIERNGKYIKLLY